MVDQIEPRFSLAELVEASGLTERTVRHFITVGLMPPAHGRGRARYYTTDHLARLELVARLRAERLSFDEIRERLTEPAVPVAADGDTWRRIVLHPDLEVHVRAGAPDSVERLVEEMLQQAGRWFGEE